MSEQQKINYRRIALAIDFIKRNLKEQPSLDQIAEELHLSPLNFQRLFSEWVGTTPKKFLQYTTITHAKKLLKKEQATLFANAIEIGLSGSGRLHDLFVKIEGMTPGEYKNGGENLKINYRFFQSPFGSMIIASTVKGICYMAFVDDEKEALMDLKQKFSQAKFQHAIDVHQPGAMSIFQLDWNELPQIKLHLKGSEFQLKVWESLLKIPMGSLSTYGRLATQIGNAQASRAVGTAIGSNPIAFLIPCHRVIQSTGNMGGYMWGNTRKTAMIAWESAKFEILER